MLSFARLAAHFAHRGQPNRAVVLAVLEGRAPGAVWETPRGGGALVVSAFGMAFVAGELSTEEQDGALALLHESARRRADGVELILPAATPGAAHNVLGDGFSRADFRRAESDRLEFPFPADDPAAAEQRLRSLAATVPAGCHVAPMDAQIAARCRWRERIMEGGYGSVARFLREAGGLCLVETTTGRVVAEAYAAFTGGGLTEIGIFVDPDPAWRNRGLGTAASALLALRILREGRCPAWSCDADNEGSARIAEKLGFGPGRTYRKVHVQA